MQLILGGILGSCVLERACPFPVQMMFGVPNRLVPSSMAAVGTLGPMSLLAALGCGCGDRSPMSIKIANVWMFHSNKQ